MILLYDLCIYNFLMQNIKSGWNALKIFPGIFFSQELVLSSNQLIFGWRQAATGSPVISWLKFVAPGYQ